MPIFPVKARKVAGAPAGSSTSPAFGGYAGTSSGAKTVRTAGVPASRVADPRAPSTPGASYSVAQTNSFDLGNLPAPTIGTSTFQIQDTPIVVTDPSSGINELELDISETFTGTVTTTLQFSSAINRMVILNGSGLPIFEMPGNTFPQLWYIAHSYQNQNGNNTLVANQTTVQTASVVFPGLELPALPNNQTYKLRVIYDTLTNCGGTQATADTVATRFGGLQGSTPHGTSNFYWTTYSFLSGVTYPSIVLPAQNVLIQRMYIYANGSGFTTADISDWTITSNGSNVEPFVTGTQLAARQTQQFNNNVPSGSLIYTPRTNWFFNATSKWRINMANARTNCQIGFEYYTPVGASA